MVEFNWQLDWLHRAQAARKLTKLQANQVNNNCYSLGVLSLVGFACNWCNRPNEEEPIDRDLAALD